MFVETESHYRLHEHMNIYNSLVLQSATSGVGIIMDDNDG